MKLFKGHSEKKAAKIAQREAEEEQKAAELAAHKTKLQRIKGGKVRPIAVDIKLNDGEKAYFATKADRMATVNSVRTETVTTGKTKKKGGSVVGRGLVGGILLGPAGMVAGAATAKGKNSAKSVSNEVTVSETKQLDRGQFIITNQRIMLIGDRVLSVKHSDILSAKKTGLLDIVIRYPEMEKNEFFRFDNAHDAEEAECYFDAVERLSQLAGIR